MSRTCASGLAVLLALASGRARGSDDADANANVDANANADAMKRLGLHLAQDFRLKWRASVPAFEVFTPGDGQGSDPWGVAGADVSLPNRSGRLKLGLGIGRLGWRVDSTTMVEGNAARVKVRLGLDVGAGRLTLQLPDVMVTPRYNNGQLGFDWVIPILEERF